MKMVVLALVLLTTQWAWAAEEAPLGDLRIRLEACQAETSNLRELAQQYRSADLAGDLVIASLRAQRDALYQEVERLRHALGIANPDVKGEAK